MNKKRVKAGYSDEESDSIEARNLILDFPHK
jgi:hypothetical protein